MLNVIKMLKPNNISAAEHNYLVFSNDGAIATNGKIALRYGRHTLGDWFNPLIDEVGEFVIWDAKAFLRMLKLIQTTSEIQSVKIDKDKHCLNIKFNSDRAKIHIPIGLGVERSTLTHHSINWYEEGKEDENTIIVPINIYIDEFYKLIHKGTNLLYGDELGLYGYKGNLIAYDLNTLIVAEDVIDKDINFFIPIDTMDLSLQDIDYLVLNKEFVILMNKDVQCAIRKSASTVNLMDSNDIITPRASLVKDKFNSAKHYKVNIFEEMQVWKRSRAFSSEVVNKEIVNLVINDGKISIKTTVWEEMIGTTEAPNVSLYVTESLLSRWGRLIKNHVIAISDTDDYYIGGISRGDKFNFYSSLVANIEDKQHNEVEDYEDIVTINDDGSTDDIYF